MSLDIYLIDSTSNLKKSTGIFVRRNGKNHELTIEEARIEYPNIEIEESITESEYCYSDNITHNLNTMAEECGLYMHLWRPEEIGIKYANELIEPLREGLHKLKMNRQHYEKFNPENGWGSYETLVNFVDNYLNACYEFPDSIVEVWR